MRTMIRWARRTAVRPDRGRAWRGLAVLTLIAGLLAAGAVPAAAATAHAGGSTAATAARVAAPKSAKPAPVPPAGIPVGKVSTPKPNNGGRASVRPLTPITVTLSASKYETWPTLYTTLTATASQDVVSTVYYIYIYDDDTNSVVCSIGSGTTCQVAETKPTPAGDTYFAYISVFNDNTAAHAVAFSGSVGITWLGAKLSLAASAHTVAVGTAVSLTATSDLNFGPSPFFIEIWDTTTDTLLNPTINSCGSGTVCPQSGQAAITVTEAAATTHSFVATLAAAGSGYPPDELQSTSPVNYVTWTASGYQLWLSAPALTINGATPITVKANVDVGPTPYYIVVFDETTGTRIASFGSNPTGTQTFSYQVPQDSTHNVVAFISFNDTALPPSGIQASSNTVTVSESYIG